MERWSSSPPCRPVRGFRRTEPDGEHRDREPPLWFLHPPERCRGRPRWGQPGGRPRWGLRSDRGRADPGPAPDGHDLPQPEPEPRDVRTGDHPHRRGHGRNPVPDPERSAMTETVRAERAGARWLTVAAWRGLFRDRPIIPLLGLLGVLMVVRELVRARLLRTPRRRPP